MNKELLSIAVNKQKNASNPHIHSWVSASAGSGKTTVLVRRILRLLLLDNVSPENITAITYTKAGANEMSNRIVGNLNKWAVMDESELKAVLESVLGEAPTDKQTLRARSLFAKVLDTKGGLKIQTIHSFCQSLLARFPLESGVAQGFRVVEDNRPYIEKAKQILINNPDALKHIQKYAVNVNAKLDELFKGLSDNTNVEKFTDIINTQGMEQTIQKMYDDFNFSKNTTAEQLYDEYYNALTSVPKLESKSQLLNTLALEKDSRNYVLVQTAIKKYFDTGDIEYLRQALFTKTGSYRQSPPFFKQHQETFQPIIDIYYDYKTKLDTHNLLSTTTSVYKIAESFIDIYAGVKKSHNVLDFGDIIIKTKQLLEKTNIADWVLFKTDYGHKHILLDEAQDTAPIQWQIIHKIISPFFYSDQMDNTLFVVGDEKQSIYSFQGAEAKNFNTQQQSIAETTKNSGQPYEHINFDLSFRTTTPVLDWVDNVFDGANEGVSNIKIKHYSNREKALGKVKLLPALKDLPKDSGLKLSLCYAGMIAEEISSIIDTQYLPSEGRYATAGDIIVLVRSRNDFVNGLIRELRNRDIGVEGADRVILNEQIAVKDLMALLRFSVFPEDDLNTACLLKSPLFGFDDEKLFEIANNRGGKSLWQVLREQSKYPSAINYLQDVLNKADFVRPLETISNALNNPCPIGDIMNTGSVLNGRQAFVERLGKTANDFINSLLVEIVNFESSNPPTVQGFLNYFDASEIEIKREQDETANRVRIMTIHGAKGLESPVVIVPNCLNKLKAESGIVWGENGNMLMIGKTAQQIIPNVKQHLYGAGEDFKSADLFESRRLLYVAMTRAKDMLVCGGYGRKSDKNLDETWYDLLFSGIKKFDNFIVEPFVSTTNNEVWQNAENIYRPYENNVCSVVITNQDIAEAPTIKETSKIQPPDVAVPDWAMSPASNEVEKYAKVSPSQTADYEPPARPSPLTEIDNYDGLKIGNIIHKCLEIAPNIDETKRSVAIKNYLSLPAHKLSGDDQDSIGEKIIAVLDKYPHLHDENSRAEVPISGVATVDGKDRLITGFIDRLCFVENEVWIVDYKSNRNPPQKQTEIPQVYINQLSIYKQIIEKIYPAQTVKTKLLWTYNLDLMDVEIDQTI